MRPLLPDLLPGWDLILIARPALPSRSLQEIRQVLTSLLHRAQIMPPSDEI
jgi:RNase P protein component